MFFASIRTSFSVNKQKKAWMNVATTNHPHIHKLNPQTQNQWPQTTGISKFTNKHVKLKPTKLLHTHRKPKSLMPIQTKTGQQKTQIL